MKIKNPIYCTLIAAYLLFPLCQILLAEEPQTIESTISQEKFRKLQKELQIESGNNLTNPKNTSTNKTSTENLSTPPPRSLSSLSFQILFGLIFVLILAVITIRILKRLQGRMLNKPSQGTGEFFEVLETCHLGTHQKVVALRMNDEIGIIGVTPQGISMITILKEPASEIRQIYNRNNNSQVFSENLNKLLDRFKKPKKVSDLLDEVQR